MERVFDAARSCISRSWIEERFGSPGAHWKGDDFYTLNPARIDHSIGSFHIREDGKWYEFADASTGDVFDLLAAMEGKAPADVAREMTGDSPGTALPKMRAPDPEGPKADWKPIPEGRMPQFAQPPSYLTLYHDSEGNGLFYVLRRDAVAGGKKEILPLYFDGKVFRKGIPPGIGYRPLLRFPDDDKTVLVVEGEKCAHVAQAKLLEKYHVTTWHGGAAAVKKADLSSLMGRDVVLWPDNDDPGIAAMGHIAESLNGSAKVRLVDIPEGMPKGWDIADAIEEGRGIEIILSSAHCHDKKEINIEPAALDYPFRNYTDLGNAERLVDRFGGDLRYNTDKNKWTRWTGDIWDDGDQSMMTPIIKSVIQSVRDDGVKGCDDVAIKMESSAKIGSMKMLAMMEPGVPVPETAFDPDPMIINTPSGIVDLETGKLMKHERSFLCSKMAGARYNPDATCPRFMHFLEEIMVGRLDYIDFLQRWFGCCLTADTSVQTFAIFHGNGANGKSTLVELMAKVMGGYAKVAPPDTFVQKQQGSGIPNDVAALRGARMVMATETESNARLAESRVKMMTGDTVISARYMRGEFFDFAPTWKIIVSTNHRPRISGSDYGIWRRIVLVPFDFVAQGDKLDPDLPRKLIEEAEGVLAWMVRGAVLWNNGGRGRRALGISADLMEQTQEYREDEDVIGKFVSDCCDSGPQFDFMRTTAGDLFNAFVAWANNSGEKYAASMTQTSFGRAMRERGYESKKGGGGVRVYSGIAIKAKER